MYSGYTLRLSNALEIHYKCVTLDKVAFEKLLITSEEARDLTVARIKCWAIYLKGLPGDKLDYPSKTNFAVTKPEEHEQPANIDDGSYLETQVITVWARAVDKRQAGLGRKMTGILRDEVTSGMDIESIAKKYGMSPRRCHDMINEGIRMTQYILYPPHTLIDA